MKEAQRVIDGLNEKIPPWRKWGAYVSERAWGTVREDYSANGDAWNFITHDMAAAKAFRWGEDGLCGWCDRFQTMIFSLALWNGKDPILKERLFGLNPFEGNHGEDVKEVYFYLDALPTHSYMKYLYRYPHKVFPYTQLVEENRRRTTQDREYELVDTDIFAENRFFDIYVEYAKASPEDTCIRIEIFNRGPEEATISVLPQLYFRNSWSWEAGDQEMPEITAGPFSKDFQSLYADPKHILPPHWLHTNYTLSPFYLVGTPGAELLFTNNESHNERLYGQNVKSRTPYVKDAFHRYVIHREPCINPTGNGSKSCFYYKELSIPSGKSQVIYMRLTPQLTSSPLKDIEKIVGMRREESNEFYAEILPQKSTAVDRVIHRQAHAGLLWSTQFYWYHVKKWLEGDNPQAAPPESRYNIRNEHWMQLRAHDLLIMPDKWEYPWFASWDAVFHCLALSSVDLPFAKHQLGQFLHYLYQNPNGQVPAYEWEFSDTNPPVQAWGAWILYKKENKGDLEFLHMCFIKLLYNFGWWVNKVDKLGNNVFEGGFLGMDNISIIDRSKPLSDGGFFEQSDGTGWMGFFSLTMMKIALELTKLSADYEKMAILFFENFMQIALAMQGTKARPMDLWDNEDGFFYDVLCKPDGTHHRLKVRSFVGLVPFFACEGFDEEELKQYTHFYNYLKLFVKFHPMISEKCVIEIESKGRKKILFSLSSFQQMKSVLQYAFNPEEFLAPFGLRSLSKYHQNHPYDFHGHHVAYEPGESLERIMGGNSNWRGPIWMPTNFLFLDSLKRLDALTEGSFSIKIGEKTKGIQDLIHDLRERLTNLFRPNAQGVRPIFDDCKLFNKDPEWKELLLFFEHYHPETGRGLGASHQTGWSALVATLLEDKYRL